MDTKRVILGDVNQVTEHDFSRYGSECERANFEVAILDEEIIHNLGDDVAHQTGMVEDDIAHPHHGHKPDDENEAIGQEKMKPIIDGGAFDFGWLHKFLSCGGIWRILQE